VPTKTVDNAKQVVLFPSAIAQDSQMEVVVLPLEAAVVKATAEAASVTIKAGALGPQGTVYAAVVVTLGHCVHRSGDRSTVGALQSSCRCSRADIDDRSAERKDPYWNS
jgi:hypothetical protein